MVFRRLRDWVELSWGSAQIAGMPDRYRFTESGQGSAKLPPQSVAEPLRDDLSDAARYLSSSMPDSERIKTLTENLKALNTDGEAQVETRERRLAWRAGLGTNESSVRAGLMPGGACRTWMLNLAGPCWKPWKRPSSSPARAMPR